MHLHKGTRMPSRTKGRKTRNTIKVMGLALHAGVDVSKGSRFGKATCKPIEIEFWDNAAGWRGGKKKQSGSNTGWIRQGDGTW